MSKYDELLQKAEEAIDDAGKSAHLGGEFVNAQVSRAVAYMQLADEYRPTMSPVPEHWTPEQINAWNEMWQQIVAGDPDWMKSVRFVPSGR